MNKEELKSAIFVALTEHPGIRKREIPLYVRGLNRRDAVLLVSELEDEGKVYSEPYSDPANMEWYDMWYAV